MVFYTYMNGGILLGKELEYKLHVENEAALLRILADEELCCLAVSPLQETKMKTTYFDAEDRRFSSRHWTLRHRQEGVRRILCIKTPLDEPHARGEWEIEADSLNEKSIGKLVETGAPAELRSLYAEGNIAPLCGAEFLRRHVMLRFPDGSEAELAGDCGILHGKAEAVALCELELELYSGTPDETIALVKRLCERYNLREQPLSKFARARSLK